MSKVNQYKAAFTEPANVLGVAGLTALSLALLNPLPLLVGIVAEAAYLIFVPDTKWFLDRLDKRYDAEVAERRRKLKTEVWDELSFDVRNRFERLEETRDQISSRTFEGKRWYREVLRKLDYMLEKFLMFGVKQSQFRTYLASVLNQADPGSQPPPIVVERKRKRGPETTVDMAMNLSSDEEIRNAVQRVQDHYQAQIDEILSEVSSDENLHNQAVLEKRQEVLGRRKEFVAKIGETLLNIRHQLDLMEDTFGMINDQIRTLSPEQVLADIDQVVSQTDTLTERLQDVSPFENMELEKGADKLYDVQEETT
ncbi:MAG: hypothetical protein JSS66_18375 [Armatimonadetes bacterium]|nr:hypothetical protein [Armatimonadota bacterium]